ncbi:MAG: HDOD domain-containing protein, partial [Gammaproteobacteria bacterium]
PMLPEVVHKVIQLTADPDSGAADLVKVIQGDQALAARVMRIANSAAYSPTASIVSLQQAIARLGMLVVRDISVAASMNARLFHAPGFETTIQEIWDHALATALWAKEIARHARRNVEAAFLCGLLHSVGRPIVIQEMVDVGAQQKLALTQDIVLAIADELHIEAAGLALEKWEMPSLVRNAIVYQEDWEHAGHARDQAMIVNAARALACFTLWNSPDRDQLADLPVLEALNLYPDEFEALLDQNEVILSGMEAMKS